MVLVILVLVNIMDVDSDTPVGGSANPSAHRRGVTARPDDRRWRHLWNEYFVVPRVSRHRMGVRALRDLFDQEIDLRIDHTQDGTAVRTASRLSAVPARAGIVPVITGVEVDFVGARDVADVGKILAEYR
jgi:hypothetical protein